MNSATDPHLIFDLRAKLDGAGHYDDFDVERVVKVEMNPKAKQAEFLTGMSEVGAGGIYEKGKVLLDGIIERVNGLFDGELSDGDQLAYVTNFLRSHMAASNELRVQAANNTSAQFANSPTLRRELMYATMDSDAAFNAMSRQVRNSETVREELLKILLGPGQLYEMLREEANAEPSNHPRSRKRSPVPIRRNSNFD